MAATNKIIGDEAGDGCENRAGTGPQSPIELLIDG